MPVTPSPYFSSLASSAKQLDALKAIMAGARAVQMVSELLENGPGQIKMVVDGLAQ